MLIIVFICFAMIPLDSKNLPEAILKKHLPNDSSSYSRASTRHKILTASEFKFDGQTLTMSDPAKRQLTPV